MSGLVLHSFRRCPFAIRVRMTLEEKGRQYTVIEEDLAAPSARLLSLNPSGEVPVLICDGAAIAESAIITEFLDETFPEPRLMPETPAGRAQVRSWTAWCARTFKPDLDNYKYGWADLGDGARGELIVRLYAALAKIDAQLGEKPFLLGDRLTLADIHLFPFYRQLTRAKVSGGALEFPDRLDAWLKRLTSRSSFLRAMATPGSTSS